MPPNQSTETHTTIPVGVAFELITIAKIGDTFIPTYTGNSLASAVETLKEFVRQCELVLAAKPSNVDVTP